MLGLAATSLLGWWWLDNVAALALIPFLIKAGREAIRGECAVASGRKLLRTAELLHESSKTRMIA